MKANGVKTLQWLLCGYAFFMPVSISGAEPLAFASLALWLILLARGTTLPGAPSPYRWPIAIFLASLLLASLLGVNPSLSLSKVSRFLLLGVVFIIPSVFCGSRDVDRLVGFFVTGAVAKGLYDIVRVPVEVTGGTPLFQTGNMREPQLYAVALCCLLGRLMLRPGPMRDRAALCALAVTSAGLVLHFKRGAWLAFVFSAIAMALLSGRRRVIAVILLCAACLVALPPVRERIAMTRQEFSLQLKGRYPLWTQAAPGLMKAHPFGMGWKAVRHEDLRAQTRFVQNKLNHLHSNPLQIAVELGWIGLCAWLGWMAFTFGYMTLNYARARNKDAVRAAQAIGLLGAFLALMINGLVEYNFGDAEIFMVLCFLMALSAVNADSVLDLSTSRPSPLSG